MNNYGEVDHASSFKPDIPDGIVGDFQTYRGRLDRKVEFLSLEDFGIVDIEEIGVQDRLQHSC